MASRSWLVKVTLPDRTAREVTFKEQHGMVLATDPFPKGVNLTVLSFISSALEDGKIKGRVEMIDGRYRWGIC